VKDPSEIVQTGQQVTAEILNVDSTDRKIRLSIRARERSEEARAFREFQRQEGNGTSKLGELIQDKLSKLKTAALTQAKAASEAGAEKATPAAEPEKPAAAETEKPEEPSDET